MKNEVPEFVGFLRATLDKYYVAGNPKNSDPEFIQSVKGPYVEIANEKMDEMLKESNNEIMLKRMLGESISDVFYSYFKVDI